MPREKGTTNVTYDIHHRSEYQDGMRRLIFGNASTGVPLSSANTSRLIKGMMKYAENHPELTSEMPVPDSWIYTALNVNRKFNEWEDRFEDMIKKWKFNYKAMILPKSPLQRGAAAARKKREAMNAKTISMLSEPLIPHSDIKESESIDEASSPKTPIEEKPSSPELEVTDDLEALLEASAALVKLLKN